MTNETNPNPLPADPGARAVYEQWNQSLAEAQAAPPAHAAVAPNQRALEMLNATQGGVNPASGRRYYDESPALRQIVERLRVQVLEGKQFDEAAAKREVAKALGVTLPEPPAVVPPAGTPEQRAADAAWKPATELTEGDLHGYQPFDISDGVHVNPEALADYLAPASVAGIGQEQVQRFLVGLSQYEAAQPERSIAEHVPADDLGREDWGGFQPLGLPAGLTIDREQFAAVMSLARLAGIGQDQMETALAAYLQRIREAA